MHEPKVTPLVTGPPKAGILSRITSDGRFVPEIDGLRFAAIASVVFLHLQQFVMVKGVVPFSGYGVFTQGFRGVQLFFVISGFILGIPFARYALLQAPKVKLGKYFSRRLTRLEPPYILNLLICFLLLIVVRHDSPAFLLPHLLANMTYVHNLVYPTQPVINSVVWSLEIEVQFYCLVPLLSAVFLIKKKLVRRGTIVAIMLAAMVSQIWLLREYQTILKYLQFFMAGFLLADIYLCDWREVPVTGWAWDIVSLVGWPLVFLSTSPLFEWIFPFLVLGLYCAAFRGKLFRAFFRHRVITTIGGMCYSIYLFHQMVIITTGHVVNRFHLGHNPHVYFATQAALMLPIVAFVSVAYFLLVERPCMDRDWPSKLWAKLTRKHGEPKVTRSTNIIGGPDIQPVTESSPGMSGLP